MAARNSPERTSSSGTRDPSAGGVCGPRPIIWLRLMIGNSSSSHVYTGCSASRRLAISSARMRSTPCTDNSGTAKVSSPTLTIRARVMDRVSGMLMVKVVPWPGSESMSIRPPSCLTSVLTTSMPTPRPATWLTVSAVEKPGSMIMFSSSSRGTLMPGSSRPRSTALRCTASRSMPAPSSRMRSTMSEPSRAKLSSMVPVSGLPAMRRCDGDSMPWAMALRSMCSMGGMTRSSTLRSSSPSMPCSFSSTCLPSSAAVWRTMRRRRGAWLEKGTMRVRISPSCSSVLTRDCCSSRVSDSWVRLARIARSESRSDRDSIMPRESCCIWVKRSNSRGSNSS